MSQRCIISRRQFTQIWIGVAVFSFLCGTILATLGLLYVYVLLRAESVIFSVELLGVSVQPGLYPYMATASLLIATIHLYHFTNMMRRSIQTRSLQFSHHFAPHKNGPVHRVSRTISTAVEALLPSRSSYVGNTIHSLRGFATSIWSAFDVTNSNYGVVYIVREIIQTGIQTQQAYELSAHVTEAWMNQSIVFLLVLNCWATPLITFGCKVSSTPTSRLLCLMVNFVLDFVSNLAFPIALLIPYAQDFNQQTGSYDKLFWYNDVWFMQLKNGWPLVFATSVWQGFSRLLITFSMTRTLRAIAKLLQPSSAISSSLITVKSHRDSQSPAPFGPTMVVPGPVTPGPEKILSRHLSSVPALRSRAEHWGHRLLALWGLFVLALHIHASSTSTNTKCLLQVRPWFVVRSACSLMEMNCYNGHMNGNALDFEATLDSIDSQWLSYLIIRHCHAVEITPRIQDLSWLVGLKIHNSTLAKWDADAALTQTHHPNMAFVFVVATNVTSFPPALYDRDFPSKLRDIEFTYVNLTQIPPQIDPVWRQLMFLNLEGLQLPAFPDVLTKLQPFYLSVACNNFSDIPVEVFKNPALMALNLNGNPISELPPGDFRIAALDIVQTRITQIPTWLDTTSQAFELLAGMTPLCEGLRSRNISALGLSSDTELDVWQCLVSCTPVDGLRYLTGFPLEDEPTNNPSRIA